MIDAINTIDALGVEQLGHRAGRQHLQRVVQHARSPTTPNIPADRFVLQGYRYLTFFQAFKQLHGKIKSVTFWGKADDQTWLTSRGPGGRRRCCSTSRSRRSSPTGRSSIRCSSRAPICRPP